MKIYIKLTLYNYNSIIKITETSSKTIKLLLTSHELNKYFIIIKL